MVVDLRSLIGVLLRPILFVLYFLSGFFPRSRNKFVFGSWSGHQFADNSAALFDYMSKHNDQALELIWISQDKKIVRRLRDRGVRAYHAWSPRGLYASLSAGTYVFDGLTKDINHWTSRGAQRVLLRHGVGIKKVERAIDSKSHHLFKLFHGNVLDKLFWRYLLPWHTVRPDLIIATSPDHARQGVAYYGVDPERIVITGLPRNDQLFDHDSDELDAKVLRWLDEARQAGQPVVLFLPTFRDNSARLPISWDDLNDAASRIGVRILVKLHFVDDRRGVAGGLRNQSNVGLADASIIPASLFHKVDALISDYSSVTYDFILTGKPVIFFVPDYDQYATGRGFYYDYETVTPGPKATDLAGLEAALRDVVEHGHAEWADDYTRVLNMFHTYKDAGSCKRTADEIVRRCVDQTESAARIHDKALPQGRGD